MSSDISSLIDRISSCTSLEEIEDIEQQLFGRKNGLLTLALKDLQNLSPEQKKEKAKELNMLKKRAQDALAEKRSEAQKEMIKEIQRDHLDITLHLPKEERGHLHPIPEYIDKVEEIFGRMGFDVAYGPEIESEDYNFNKLNIPEDHPARDAQDTFWIKGKKSAVLRTHTSPVQIRYMLEHEPPFRMICPGKVYRKDADATHSPMFHQFEGLMVGKDISLSNLKGVLVTALQELIGRDVEFRFRTGYFPFVEPGLEMDMMWQGNLDESREGKWLEMGGCGMVHPNVLRHVNIDPDTWQGFAFGFGVERPLMIKHRIPDIRLFTEGDLRFLRQF